eukprot:1142392-Prymnesium_polylepis.1
MNSVNCATALHRLAKSAPAGRGGASERPGQRMLEVEERLCARTAIVLGTDDVTARSLTSIAWA